MGNIRRRHSVSFKTKVALELIREKDTISSICSKYSIHPTQAQSWKAQALASLPSVFGDSSGNHVQRQKDQLIEQLYQEIGRLKIELDWLKKKSSSI